MLNFISTLSIRAQLSLGFGIILALFALLTIQGIKQVDSIDHTLTEITDFNSVKQRYAINFRGSVHDRAIVIRDVAITDSKAELTKLEQKIVELERFYATSAEKLDIMLKDGTAFSTQERAILTKISNIQNQTQPIINAILNAKKAGQSVNQMVLNQARPAFIDWLAAINDFIDYQETQNQIATPQARAVAGSFTHLMLLLSGIAIALSIGIGFLIDRSLRTSLGGEPNQAQNAISSLSNGDLTQNLHSSFQGSILDSLASMSTQLTSIVKNIVKASNDLENQVKDVSDGSKLGLTAAQKQAELTQQTVLKLDSMRASIDQVSYIASRTEENSGSTANFAMQGRKAVNDAAGEIEKIANTVNNTVNQIKKLEDNTKQITGIANVINGISEQTNLLALNAAIEAARAGDSGRGFAVVADEVRQLAQRTVEATSQINSMIAEIQKQTTASVNAMETTQPQVENGKAQILTATDLLVSIEQQATDSLVQVKEVAQAAAEQVDAVGKISAAMDSVATMSAETIASMNNNNKATEKLTALSAQLKQEVDFFKI